MDKPTEKALNKAIKENNMTDFKHYLEVVKDVNHFNKNQEPLLSQAIAEGRLEMVVILVGRGASCSQTNPRGHKALHVAAKHGQVEIMDVILKNGGNITQQTDTGDTALYLAVHHQQSAAVEYLADHGSDPSTTASFLYSHNTPLHKAATFEDPLILNTLLAAKADVNRKNDDKQTPLHLASSEGREKCVMRLVACGARIDELDSNSATPLQVACDNGHGEVVRMLCVAGASINLENREEENCFKMAIVRRNIHVVRMLLHFGANVNRVFSNGRTALHTAIENCPHGMRVKWIPGNQKLSVNNEIEMFDTLLQAKADVNKLDGHKETPLHLCVRHGCAAALEYFLKNNASFLTVNASGHTPLTTACQDNVTPAIHLLLQHCPGLVHHHVNHSNEAKSPLLILTRKANLECLKVLFQAGYVVTEAERNSIAFNRAELTSSNNGNKGKNNPAVNDLLEREFYNPWALERVCGTQIRKLLNTQLSRKVMYLPLPQKLRDQLLLRNALWV